VSADAASSESAAGARDTPARDGDGAGLRGGVPKHGQRNGLWRGGLGVQLSMRGNSSGDKNVDTHAQ